MNPDQFYQDQNGNWQVRSSANSQGWQFGTSSGAYNPSHDYLSQDSLSNAVHTLGQKSQFVDSPITQGTEFFRSIEQLIEDKLNWMFPDSPNGRSNTDYNWTLDILMRRAIDMKGNRLANLAEPDDDTCATSKGYVDRVMEEAILRAKEELKKEILENTLESLRLRVRSFSLIEEK